MEHRINNPESVSRELIQKSTGEGNRVVVQFSAPDTYDDRLLREIDKLAAEFGQGIQIRFYGHYGSSFDGAILTRVPNVRSLLIDCLQSAENLHHLEDLAHLRDLSIGIFELNDPHLLARLNLQQLETLTLGETRSRALDLDPLSRLEGLARLNVVGHTKHIDALGDLKSLRALILSSIGNKTKLDFVNHIKNLGELRIILGGRRSISEVVKPELRKLEIIRVRGLEELDHLEAFEKLQFLSIEDQIRLGSLRVSSKNNQLRSLRIINCKTFSCLGEIKDLRRLRELRISRTSMDFDSLLAEGLPENLRIFGFYTGRSRLDASIRSRLDSLNYDEFGDTSSDIVTV